MSARFPAPHGADTVETVNDGLANNDSANKNPVDKSSTLYDLAIYVSQHCEVCRYAYEVAEEIRRGYPHVRVRIVELETTQEEIPEAVFATPTYLLNGRVWSLGNPSVERIQTTFQALTR